MPPPTFLSFRQVQAGSPLTEEELSGVPTRGGGHGAGGGGNGAEGNHGDRAEALAYLQGWVAVARGMRLRVEVLRVSALDFSQVQGGDDMSKDTTKATSKCNPFCSLQINQGRPEDEGEDEGGGGGGGGDGGGGGGGAGDGGQNATTVSTSIQRGVQRPSWEKRLFEFAVEDFSSAALRMDVWNHDAAFNHHFFGGVSIQLASAPIRDSPPLRPARVQLLNGQGEEAGWAHVKVWRDVTNAHLGPLHPDLHIFVERDDGQAST